MASTITLLSEADLLCPICMDVFTDPVSTPCGHNYCKACITRCWDTGAVCKCPLCSKTFKTRPETCVNTLLSGLVQRFKSHKLKEEYEAKTGAEIQQMIQERREKIQEVKRSVNLIREDTDTEIEVSVHVVFNALISYIERSWAELIGVVQEKLKTTEKRAEGFIKHLQQEVTHLENRISELEQLSHTEDHRYFTTNNTGWILNKDWTKVSVHQTSLVGTLRTAVSQLEETLSREMKKRLAEAEMKLIQRYEVDVTLDPRTAQCSLIVSEDGKQVSHGNGGRNLRDNPERFFPCVNVLGKQSFCAGRFYYEVQVGGKTDWIIGVARESINRKGDTPLAPADGYWTIWLRNGKYEAVAGPPVLLPVTEEVQKVGVFVDYEDGLVSFYDVEARVNLCSFTGCSFAERLHPFFSPCLNSNGTNSAPLVITPVNVNARLGENGGIISGTVGNI